VAHREDPQSGASSDNQEDLADREVQAQLNPDLKSTWSSRALYHVCRGRFRFGFQTPKFRKPPDFMRELSNALKRDTHVSRAW